MADPSEQPQSDEHAALAFLSIPDDATRAFWGLKVFGKRYPSILDSWCTAVLQGEPQ